MMEKPGGTLFAGRKGVCSPHLETNTPTSVLT